MYGLSLIEWRLSTFKLKYTHKIKNPAVIEIAGFFFLLTPYKKVLKHTSN